MTQNEPDRLEFTAYGLRCLILRHMGHLNGYVGVEPSHPWFGKSYSDSTCGHTGCYEHAIDRRINAHGGLTFSSVGNGEGWPLGPWWFGFDTHHAGDDPQYGGTYKDIEYVKRETRKLAKQLREVQP